ncbi:MAG: DeoR/GlpR family DNA-binding transcription regulator [Propioniciclava sp.]|uniref:DeoR/GlpR family DNA-binding transcription regulator n=1 Tax=Propioniciclava sp. TaxID=2038686 RepID=UPI0039E3351F
MTPHDESGTPHPRRGTRERRLRMAQLVAEQGSPISLHELQDRFDVSEATLRRDLAALSKDGKLVRVYGGVAPGRPAETTWREKAAAHADSKMRIAQFVASELISPGDVVFIDSGTTPAAVARQLAHREDVTVVVAGLAALLELADGAPNVIVLGGRFRRRSASFLGQAADLLLDMVSPDVAILGTDMLDPHLGANYPELGQAIFKARVIGRSTTSWFVGDESKIGHPPPFRHWTPIKAPAGIVTVRPSHQAGLDAIEAFRGAGVGVHVVAPQ